MASRVPSVSFEKLQAKLEWYQNMMDGEARDERAKLKAINFKRPKIRLARPSAPF